MNNLSYGDGRRNIYGGERPDFFAWYRKEEAEHPGWGSIGWYSGVYNRNRGKWYRSYDIDTDQSRFYSKYK